MAEPLQCVSDNWACLIMPEHESGFSSGWFSETYWGTDAEPVSEGGRGGAWFIDAGDKHWVLRHYQRGGLIARLSRSSYVYTGLESTRAFAEFRLLTSLFQRGLPVPEPVAAGVQRLRGFRYRAAIVIKRIEDVSPLGVVAGQLPLQSWAQTGVMIRKFHDASVYHPDLNCFNILISGDQSYLIDFDKARYRMALFPDWRHHTLERLRRSILKLPKDAWPGYSLDEAWDSLMTGYQKVVSHA